MRRSEWRAATVVSPECLQGPRDRCSRLVGDSDARLREGFGLALSDGE
jgi:hypothetical protein